MSDGGASRYVVEIDPAATRDLERIKRADQQTAKRIAKKLRALADNPRPNGVEKLGGATHRVRVGDWRIVFDIDDKRVRVLVLRVRHRSEVYRRLR